MRGGVVACGVPEVTSSRGAQVRILGAFPARGLPPSGGRGPEGSGLPKEGGSRGLRDGEYD